ncbi:MAG TPA: hypothetical protein VKA50_14525 [Gammaproteobacteria bacterium]|nr:hypothetical protein [Gammaproteobacteria bacterium]
MRKCNEARRTIWGSAGLAAGIALAAQPAIGADTTSMQNQIDELQREVTSLKDTVKAPDSVVHLAGYGSAGFSSRKSDSTFQVFSFSPIFHYQYKDLMLMQAELEMGYNEDGSTETVLEYASLNLIMNDHAVLVAGQFLSPIGQFRQNLHPAWINKLPSKPLGFADGGAAPLTETGVEVRGGFTPGGHGLNYALYVGNGPKLVDNAGELEVETEGNSSDANKNKTVGGRIGYLPLHNLEIGVSAAAGKANLPGEDNRNYRVYDVDFAFQPAVVELRGEYVQTKVDSLAGSAIPDEHTWKAWYVQASHKFAPSRWEAVLRYGKFTPPEKSQELKQWAAGLNYLFASNVIGKLSYEKNDGPVGSVDDENRFVAQLAYGF